MGDVIPLPVVRVEHQVDGPCDVEITARDGIAHIGPDERIVCGIDFGLKPSRTEARMFMKVDTPQGPRFVEVFSPEDLHR